MFISAIGVWFYQMLHGLFSDFNVALDWSYDSIAIFRDYVKVGLYFLPVGTIQSIFNVVLGLQLFRILVSLFKTVWAILPVV